MPSEYPRSPKLVKGALIKLSEEFLGPVPNIIVFQYNPETMSRDLSPWWEPAAGAGKKKQEETTAQPFDPSEKFSLKLLLDATDALEEPVKHPVAMISGVADRIAALEMLLYPVTEAKLRKAVTKQLTKNGKKQEVPKARVPLVLFAWGPGRILPVRLTSFQVEEQAFSPTLYPIRATVTVGLQVLTDQAEPFAKPTDKLSASEKLALAAYKYTRGQKQVLARTNMNNTRESVTGMLPFPF